MRPEAPASSSRHDPIVLGFGQISLWHPLKTKHRIAKTLYSPEAIAAALNASGGNRTAADVTAASQKERAQVPALANLGPGITAFEALVIAADGGNHGGLQLDPPALDKFLSVLLK